MSEIKEIPSCCMNCDMFRVFGGQCTITETYIDDYLDKRAPNCPLGIVTCKDCEHWNKKNRVLQTFLVVWSVKDLIVMDILLNILTTFQRE